MVYFITYPVTPDMGLRESINAMLGHVAWHSSMGYQADPVHRANYESLLRDYPGEVRETYDRMSFLLTLQPVIRDSANLGDLVDTLVELCNDYPLHDDEVHSRIVHDDLMEYLKGCDIPEGIDPEVVAYALFDIGAETQDNDGSAFVRQDDFDAAIAHIPNLQNN